jgi:hypothetical protein
MKLYMIHCGFYDPEVCDGIYESHVNLFVTAESFESARRRVRENTIFSKRRMHIDGMEEIEAVNGSRIRLEIDPALEGKTVTTASRHRDL